ncbi:3-oxoacyl-ACP reductase-like protein, partial [Leptotrombidium deliense]
WVRTKIHEKTSLPDTVYDLKAKNYPLKRPGEPEEVANVICFMASGLASFVTGSAVFVDGGHMIY